MDGGSGRRWLQERVGGGVGAMAVPKKGEGLVGCSKERQVQGRGPRALVAGEGWGGRRDDGSLGLGWLFQSGGRRGCKGFGCGGVGGRGTGPRDGANFATCVVFLLFLTRTKRRKTAFFEGCPVWGRQERVGGGA